MEDADGPLEQLFALTEGISSILCPFSQCLKLRRWPFKNILRCYNLQPPLEGEKTSGIGKSPGDYVNEG